MKNKIIFSSTIALFILVLGFGSAFAQGNPITAVTDRNTLSTDESLLLTVTINTATGSPGQPALPTLDGFQITGTSSGTQVSIVNSKMTSSATYQYRLQPIEAGDLIIEPISVEINGQTFSTEPIAVQVTPGSAPVQAAPGQPSGQAAPTELVGQDFFVEAFVDNDTPYQGEQINYVFRFYHAVNLSRQANYQSPSYTGFWSDAQPEQVQYTVQEANRVYSVNELRTSLFPTVAGELTIDPTHLSIPSGFFSNGADLMTQPVTVNVQPLPPNPPMNFNGAVGQYRIAAVTDLQETKVNEPITWQVMIGGYGNIDTLPEPIWPDTPEWRAFDSSSTTTTQMEDARMSGSQKYDRLLVPTQAGEMQLPAIEFSYFDPETAVYETITTEPITINVLPGVNGETASDYPTVGDDAVSSGTDTAVANTKTLRPNKLVASTQSSEPLTQSGLYWFMWLIPLFGLVGQFGYQKRQAYLANNSSLIRSQKAQKQAHQALKKAHKQKDDPFATASDILLTYMSQRLNQTVQGLTLNQLSVLLISRGASNELVVKAEQILTRCEMGRYAPIQDDNLQADNLLGYTKSIIDELEQELKI